MSAVIWVCWETGNVQGSTYVHHLTNFFDGSSNSSNHFLAFNFLFSLLFFKTSLWSFFHFSFINYWSKHKKKRVLIIFGRFPLMICLLANPVIWNCTSVSWRLLFSHVCKLSSGRASSLSGHERFGGKSWGLCEVGTYTQHKLPAFKFVFFKEKKNRISVEKKRIRMDLGNG